MYIYRIYVILPFLIVRNKEQDSLRFFKIVHKTVTYVMITLVIFSRQQGTKPSNLKDNAKSMFSKAIRNGGLAA
jgi:hypothetical protein